MLEIFHCSGIGVIYIERIQNTKRWCLKMRYFSVLVCIFMFSFPTYVYADTLEELANNSHTVERLDEYQVDTETEERIDQTKDMLKGLTSVNSLMEKSETVDKLATPLRSGTGFLVQLGCLVLSLGMILRVIIDLIYISVPFLRGTLSGGTANSKGNSGYGDSMMGGYGDVYGSNSYSGGGKRANSSGKIFLASDEAISVVQNRERDGNPYKQYAKSMIIFLVVPFILITLMLTGVLMDIGFALGGAISSFLSGLGGYF